jgi:hypothetical protein
VHYFLDGAPLATHGEPYYPEDLMSINFNLWFIREGPIASRGVASIPKTSIGSCTRPVAC